MKPEIVNGVVGMLCCFMLGAALGVPAVVMGVIKREKYNDPRYQITISEGSLSAYHMAFLLFIVAGSILLVVSVSGMVYFGILLKKKYTTRDPSAPAPQS